MTAKTFKVVGVSLHNGRWAVRYAQTLSRAKVLTRNGHERVFMFAMPFEGSKEDAVDHLLSQQFNIGCAEAFAEVKREAEKLGFMV